MPLEFAINTLTDTMKGLHMSFKNYHDTFEGLIQATVKVGQEQSVMNGKLLHQFTGLGIALDGVGKIFTASIKTGVELTKENRKLFATIHRFGLNLGAFTDMMGTAEQVFGLSTEASTHLARTMLDLGVTFGRDADLLVKAVESLAEPMNKISGQFGAAAGADFASTVATLTAVLPKAGPGIGGLLSKFTGTTPEEFQRSAILGLQPGQFAGGASVEGAREIAAAIMGRAQAFGVGAAGADPRMISFFTSQLDLTAQDLNIARQIMAIDEARLEAEIEGTSQAAREREIALRFSNAWNNILLSMNSVLLPIMGQLSEIVATVFNPAAGFFEKFVQATLGPTAEYIQKVSASLDPVAIGHFFDNLNEVTQKMVLDLKNLDFPGITDIVKLTIRAAAAIAEFVLTVGPRFQAAFAAGGAAQGWWDAMEAFTGTLFSSDLISTRQGFQQADPMGGGANWLMSLKDVKGGWTSILGGDKDEWDIGDVQLTREMARSLPDIQTRLAAFQGMKAGMGEIDSAKHRADLLEVIGAVLQDMYADGRITDAEISNFNWTQHVASVMGRRINARIAVQSGSTHGFLSGSP